MIEIETLLRNRFKLAEFRRGQREVIESILAGQNVMAVMPTGYGKSLCYQLPAWLRDGLTVVVSPLVALMKDQVDALIAKGLTEVTLINSSVPLSEQRNRLQAVKEGRFRLVYIAPERFRSRAFLNSLKPADVRLFVVDEAHCISQWGHDFRPDYLALKEVIGELGSPQVTAFTATATPQVRQDIKDQLGIADTHEFLQSVARESLEFFVYQIADETEKLLWLKRLIEKIGGKGIIYAGRRRDCEQINAFLQSVGIHSEYFHAKRTEREKRTIQERFMDDRHNQSLNVVVATNAFGLGIDKANIRFVIHSAITGTVEEYFQEAGRAGRDGERAFCVLLYSYNDRSLQEYFIENSLLTVKELKTIYESILAFSRTGDYRIVEPQQLERQLFMDDTKIRVGISHLERLGLIARLPDIEPQIRIRVLYTGKRNERSSSTQYDSDQQHRLVDTILEQAQADASLDLVKLCTDHSFDPASVIEAIDDLEFEGVLSVQRGARAMLFRMLQERVRWHKINPQALGLEQFRANRYDKLDKMFGYAETQDCRVRYIREYFEEQAVEACGKCDNCRAHKKNLEAQPNSDARHSIYFDEQRLQRAFLMTVRDTRGHVGKALVVDILRGSQSKAVTGGAFQKLPACGRLAYFRKEPLLQMLKNLILKGLINERTAAGFDYPVVTLSSAGSALLAEMESEQPEITWPEPPTRLLDGDMLPYRALKEWRLAKAKQSMLPAFCILWNQTLLEIAILKPSNLFELSLVSKMSERNIKTYGAEILGVLHGHVSAALRADRFSDADRQTVNNFLNGVELQKLIGPFDAGYALAPHSKILVGNMQYTPIGLKLFEYKYRGKKSHLHDLADEMVSFIRNDATLRTAELILPTPATLSDREYDPVLCLVEQVGKQTGLAVGKNILIKTRKTEPQKSMVNMTQKEQNVRGAFRVNQPQIIAGKRVIVVDDLYDSGATCRECTRVLREAGAAAVYVLTVTRTIHSI